MPTKIILGPSNPANGEINRQDLLTIINDYKTNVQVQVQSTPPRQLVKTNGISIPFWLMKKLLDDSFNRDGDISKCVSIHFGISLPGQKNCMDNFVSDLPNQLTVVVNIGEMNAGGIDERFNENDEIITLGFKPQPSELVVLDENLPEGERAANCCANPK